VTVSDWLWRTVNFGTVVDVGGDIYLILICYWWYWWRYYSTHALYLLQYYLLLWWLHSIVVCCGIVIINSPHDHVVGVVPICYWFIDPLTLFCCYILRICCYICSDCCVVVINYLWCWFTLLRCWPLWFELRYTHTTYVTFPDVVKSLFPGRCYFDLDVYIYHLRFTRDTLFVVYTLLQAPLFPYWAVTTLLHVTITVRYVTFPTFTLLPCIWWISSVTRFVWIFVGPRLNIPWARYLFPNWLLGSIYITLLVLTLLTRYWSDAPVTLVDCVDPVPVVIDICPITLRWFPPGDLLLIPIVILLLCPLVFVDWLPTFDGIVVVVTWLIVDDDGRVLLLFSATGYSDLLWFFISLHLPRYSEWWRYFVLLFWLVMRWPIYSLFGNSIWYVVGIFDHIYMISFDNPHTLIYVTHDTFILIVICCIVVQLLNWLLLQWHLVFLLILQFSDWLHLLFIHCIYIPHQFLISCYDLFTLTFVSIHLYITVIFTFLL